MPVTILLNAVSEKLRVRKRAYLIMTMKGPSARTDDPLPRAGNRTRTGDPNLGKVVLYQLSYSRRSRGDQARNIDWDGQCRFRRRNCVSQIDLTSYVEGLNAHSTWALGVLRS